MPNLLTIDIGNTNISVGLFKDDTLINSGKIPTVIDKGIENCAGVLKEIVKEHPDAIIISSVVPSATDKLKMALKSLFNVSLLVVGEDIDPNVKNLYDANASVGIDRLVNASAAIYLYGYPVIIIDFGTAITVDIISEKGEFLGGIIMAGIRMSLNGLSSATSLLPHISDITPPDPLAGRVPTNLIGTDTISCMKSGIFYGTSSMIDGLLSKIRENFGSTKRMCSVTIPAIATGGDAEVIYPYCKAIDKVNRNLTLEGLRIIFYNKEIYRENK